MEDQFVMWVVAEDKFSSIVELKVDIEDDDYEYLEPILREDLFFMCEEDFDDGDEVTG